MEKDIQHRRRLNTDIATKEQWGELIELIETIGPEEAHKRLHGTNDEELSEFHEKEETADSTKIIHYSKTIKTVDDLVAYHGIDTEIWEQKLIKTNYWEVGMKIKKADGSMFPITHPLHQIWVEWKRKAPLQLSKETILNWVAEAHNAFPLRVNDPIKWASKTDCCLEILIPDLHIGKVGVNDNWTMQRIKEVWFGALYDFIARAGRFDQVIIPIGNDFLHTDNLSGTTTAGTRMDYQYNWFQTLIFAGELIAETVAALPSDVEVILPFVYGNHDTQSTLALAEIVRNRFITDKRVQTPTPGINGRHYLRFGDTLLAYMHGDAVKGLNIHATVATECPFWSECRYRFARVGHLHKRQRDVWSMTRMTDEVNGLEIETCPSLAPTDNWHDRNGYIGNIRRATAFIHHKDRGMIGQMFHNL